MSATITDLVDGIKRRIDSAIGSGGSGFPASERWYVNALEGMKRFVIEWESRAAAKAQGGVVVPREPTEEMIAAAMPKAFIGHPEASEASKERWFRSHRESLIEKYKAMIAAAPSLSEPDAEAAALRKIAALTYPHTGNVNRATKRCDQAEECPLCIARAAIDSALTGEQR